MTVQQTTDRGLRVSRRFGVLVVAGLLAALGAVEGTVDVLASSYSTQILVDNPEAYYQLDGNLNDSSGHGHTASWQSGSAFCADAAVVGVTQSFCGNGGTSVFAGATLHGGYPGTVELWLKATDHNTSQALFTGYNASGCPRWAGRLDSSVIVPGLSGCGSDGYQVGGATGACVGQGGSGWHMWDFVYEAGGQTTYEDGALCGSTTGGSQIASFVSNDTTYGTHIGGRTTDSFIQSGTHMAQVSFYTTNLTAVRIAAHYSARNPTPSTLSVHFASGQLQAGHAQQYTVNSSDSTGGDTTSLDTFAFTGVSPAGGATCGTFTGNLVTCTAGSTVGHYTMSWSSAAGSLTATSTLWVMKASTGFSVSPTTATLVSGGTIDFVNTSVDSAGVDNSGADPWAFDAQANITCYAGPAVFGPAQAIINTCSSDTPGFYTLRAVDSNGLAATVTVQVAAAAAASTSSCHSGDLVSDTVCWLSNTFNSIANLPGALLSGIYDVFFVSRTGKSYLDFAIVADAVVPTVECRSGQAATAPGGVLCFAFPFSVPSDIGTIINIGNVTPVAPTFSTTWTIAGHAHTFGFNVSTVLTSTIMDYIRGAELLLLIVGTAFGTWKWVEMAGVA